MEASPGYKLNSRPAWAPYQDHSSEEEKEERGGKESRGGGGGEEKEGGKEEEENEWGEGRGRRGIGRTKPSGVEQGSQQNQQTSETSN